MPDCRVNNRPGWTQGGHLVVPGARGVLLTRGDSVGSSGDVIVGHFAINYHNESLSECHTLRKLQTKRSTRQSGTSRAGKPISTNESRISFYLVLSSLTIAVPTIRRAGHIQLRGEQHAKAADPSRYAPATASVPIHRAECSHKYGSKTLQSAKLPFC